jgi:hypothetical protein
MQLHPTLFAPSDAVSVQTMKSDFNQFQSILGSYMRQLFIESSVHQHRSNGKRRDPRVSFSSLLTFVISLSLRIYSDNYWHCVTTVLLVTVFFLAKFCIIHLPSCKDYMTTTTSFRVAIHHSRLHRVRVQLHQQRTVRRLRGKTEFQESAVLSDGDYHWCRTRRESVHR